MNIARYKINKAVETRYLSAHKLGANMPQFDILCKRPPRCLFVSLRKERLKGPSGEEIVLCADQLT